MNVYYYIQFIDFIFILNSKFGPNCYRKIFLNPSQNTYIETHLYLHAVLINLSTQLQSFNVLTKHYKKPPILNEIQISLVPKDNDILKSAISDQMKAPPSERPANLTIHINNVEPERGRRRNPGKRARIEPHIVRIYEMKSV